MNRKPLTDRQWSIIEPYLATDKRKGGKPPERVREKVDALLWLHRTGAPWRDLDAIYHPWETVYTSFRRWTKRCAWGKVLEALVEDRDNEASMIDSTVVRAHQHAAGAKKKRGTIRRSDDHEEDFRQKSTLL